jgi:Ca2+-binding RTX toxin-like protein
MTAKIEIFDLAKLNKAGYGPIGVYVNLGYEPYPENYNPLPDSEFDSYVPDQDFIKNTGLRTPLFTGGFLSSPLLNDGDYSYLTDSQGYTWLYNTFNYMAVAPFRRDLYPAGITRYSAALYAPPPPRSIQIIVNDKNQPQTFAAKDEQGSPITHYFATDKNGNKFIIGSVDAKYAEDPSAPFKEAILTRGWRKSTETFDENVTIYPAYGDGNRKGYNQFRDNLTNNYFQVEFAANGNGVARGIPGLPLAGGNESDLITGTKLSENIYGGQGNDTLNGRKGDDQIWGDDGDDLLNPGAGRNSLWGGAGKDTFLIDKKANNIVNDFGIEGDVVRIGSSRYTLIDTEEGALIKGVSLGSTLLLGVRAVDLIAGQNLIF